MDFTEFMIEIIPGRLYFATVRKAYQVRRSDDTHHFFSTDDSLVYMSFHNDFGPLNLACVYSFIQIMKKKLKLRSLAHKKIVYYTSYFSLHGPQKRVNSAFLMGCFMVYHLRFSPQKAFNIINSDSTLHFVSFRDASFGTCTYSLTLLDCLQGFHKAVQHKFFDLNFDLEEYLHYEKVENGDFNWIVPGLFLAFCSPQDKLNDKKEKSHSPSFYLEYFKRHNITAVVRLNNKTYDSSIFTRNGINHLDLYFPDGSVPPDLVLDKFISFVSHLHARKKAIAVHCKAGLGRTGTLIGCYLMHKFHWSSREAISWLRITRPGSVIGPQQFFLDRMEKKYKESNEKNEKQCKNKTIKIDEKTKEVNREEPVENDVKHDDYDDVLKGIRDDLKEMALEAACASIGKDDGNINDTTTLNSTTTDPKKDKSYRLRSKSSNMGSVDLRKEDGWAENDENSPYPNDPSSQSFSRLAHYEACEKTQGDELNEIKQRRSEKKNPPSSPRPQFMRKCKTAMGSPGTKVVLARRENKKENNGSNKFKKPKSNYLLKNTNSTKSLHDIYGSNRNVVSCKRKMSKKGDDDVSKRSKMLQKKDASLPKCVVKGTLYDSRKTRSMLRF